jgi:hypothetical protein
LAGGRTVVDRKQQLRFLTVIHAGLAWPGAYIIGIYLGGVIVTDRVALRIMLGSGSANGIAIELVRDRFVVSPVDPFIWLPGSPSIDR